MSVSAPAASGSVTVSHVRTLLERNPFPIMLVSLVGVVLLTTFAPALVVGDTWLTLMAGREIVDHGLPRTEEITVLGQGATWTDQQWLAQLVFYAAHGLGGLRLVVVLDVAFVLLALSLAAGAARSLGASSRSTFLIGLLAVLAGPWGWTIRAQSAALPLYAGTLWLLLDAYRNGVRRRTLLVLPVLVLWANLHGSVVLGAGLTMLLGLVVLFRDRGASPLFPLALVALAPLSVLATPYGWDIVAYYDLMLVEAPFADILREWQWSKPSGTTALFWALALVGAAIVARGACRRRLTTYELLVLGVTFVGAAQAVRGVIWFALACAATLPTALDGLLTRPDPSASRANVAISSVGLGGLAAALVFALTQPASWFVESWREDQVAAVRGATRDPDVRVWATDGTADWLLWRIPDLRGRMAFDVRWEVYGERTLDQVVAYGEAQPGWRRLLDGYAVVVVDHRRHLDTLARSRGARVAYRDDEIAVVERPA